MPASSSSALASSTLASKSASAASAASDVPVASPRISRVLRILPIGSDASEPRSAMTGYSASICSMTSAGRSVVVTTRSGSRAAIASRRRLAAEADVRASLSSSGTTVSHVL